MYHCQVTTGAGRDVLVVVSQPDDEVLWLSPFLSDAKNVLVAYAMAKDLHASRISTPS
jgi:hypothetical protein